jgi:iduronate 2-sulfatase
MGLALGLADESQRSPAGHRGIGLILFHSGLATAEGEGLRAVMIKFAMVTLALSAAFTLDAAERPNVLFIAVDDLRPWLGCHDPKLAVSPNIDRLAKEGRRFSRHYVQVPTCGASRCALVFGRYPGRLAGDADNNAILKNAAKQPLPALPALFRQQGYRTVSVGKITHYPGGRGGKGWVDGSVELPGAWDEALMPSGPWKTPEGAMHGYANGQTRQQAGKDPAKKPVSQSAAGDDQTYPDGWIAEQAVKQLNDLAAGEKPFFLAAGFIKPHLPFAAPESYFQATSGITAPVPAAAGKPAFPTTWHGSGEFRQYRANEGDPFREPSAAEAYRKAYLACVRYSDAQVGKLLAALDASAAAKSTIVVLWGDHGFLLGEHAIWGKHCLFEEALHSPLIIRVPGQKKPGEATNAIVETIDVYPTLAALAGLPLSKELDGRSLVPLIEDPAAASDGMAVGFWQRGTTLRTDTHRLIVSGKDRATVELYDHREDPAETVNAAAKQKKTVEALRSRLKKLSPGS